MENRIDDHLTNSNLKMEFKFKKFDTEDLINEIISNLTLQIELNNASITHEPLPCIYADKSQIIGLFQNLICNILKYGKEQPEIHISAQKEEEYWIFEVKDYPDTSKGFLECEKIVKNHNGLIWIESNEDEDSKLFFTLPM